MPSPDGRVTRQRVVDAAAQLADAGGADAVTLSAVARAVGVRTPSLYHHVRGLDGLKAQLRLRGLETLSEAVRGATSGRAGRDALDAFGHAYLAFARAHPGLYQVTLAATTEHDGQEARDIADRALDTTLAVLRGYGLEGDAAIHAARFVRSTLHGFASLERVQGFALPQNRADSVDRMLDAIDAGLQALAPSSANADERSER